MEPQCVFEGNLLHEYTAPSLSEYHTDTIWHDFRLTHAFGINPFYIQVGVVAIEIGSCQGKAKGGRYTDWVRSA